MVDEALDGLLRQVANLVLLVDPQRIVIGAR